MWKLRRPDKRDYDLAEEYGEACERYVDALEAIRDHEADGVVERYYARKYGDDE